MAMGSSLSPVVSNIFMEHFEELALDSAQHKPSLWLRYVDDTFVVWPHGPEQLQNFLNHLNSLRQCCPTFLYIGAHLTDGCGGAGPCGDCNNNSNNNNNNNKVILIVILIKIITDENLTHTK
jgi:hypothetical protein